MRYRSVGVRGVTGLAAWMTLAACGDATQAPRAPEEASPGVTARALDTGPEFVVTSVTGPASARAGDRIDLQP
jgi:hypothetical protein